MLGFYKDIIEFIWSFMLLLNAHDDQMQWFRDKMKEIDISKTSTDNSPTQHNKEPH